MDQRYHSPNIKLLVYTSVGDGGTVGDGVSVGGTGVFVGGGGLVGSGGSSVAVGVRVRVGRKVGLSVWVGVSVVVGVGTVGEGVKEGVTVEVAEGFGVGVSRMAVGVQVLGSRTVVAVGGGAVRITVGAGGGRGFRLLAGFRKTAAMKRISKTFPIKAKIVRIFQVESFTFLNRFKTFPHSKLSLV